MCVFTYLYMYVCTNECMYVLCVYSLSVRACVYTIM